MALIKERNLTLLEEYCYAEGDYKKHLENEIVKQNIRLVYDLAKHMRHPACDWEDIVSHGTIGMLKAVRTFDASKGFLFATYAAHLVRNEIFMFFRSLNAVTRNPKEPVLYLDQQINEDYEETYITRLVDEEVDVEGSVAANDLRDRIHDIIENGGMGLNLVDRQVLGYLVNDQRNQADIAKAIGVSQSYVSRSMRKVQLRLKHYLYENGY